MSDEHIISIRDVSKEFGGVKAVNDVNLEVRRGEFFSLLGPSGRGKTTLLRMLAGFESPTRGARSSSTSRPCRRSRRINGRSTWCSRATPSFPTWTCTGTSPSACLDDRSHLDVYLAGRDEPVAVAMQNAGRSAVGIDQIDQPVWLSWADDAIVLLSGD